MAPFNNLLSFGINLEIVFESLVPIISLTRQIKMSIEVKKILKKYKISPSKGLGQNFLADKRVLRKIVTTAELKPDDIVLEIGPGPGNLTLELAKRVKRVVAIEKDPKMVEILKNVIDEQGIQNVQIIQDDVLKIKNWKFNRNLKFKIKNYKVVANLPYYIASPIIRYFLEAVDVKPQQMILMVQKEVAQRICAKPPNMTHSTSSGSSRASRGMSILAVSVQFYAKPEIISYVSKKAFWPSPKVDSAIIKIVPILQGSDPCKINKDLFFQILKMGFSHPRKQLLNNLSQGLKLNREEIMPWLLKNNIQPTQRAETLSIEDWLNLVKSSKIE